MNNINRVLVKSQAKKLIRDRVFVLFIVSAIALVLTNGFSVYTGVKDGYDSVKNGNNYSYNDDSSLDDYNDYYDYFNQFSNDEGYQSSNENPLENFGKNTPQSYTPETAGIAGAIINTNDGGAFSISALISVIFSPLFVTLCGFYLMLIRKNPEEELSLGAEIKSLFKKSFDSSFLKKLLVYVLRGLFVSLLSILLVVPGVVYYYSTYFAFQIMNDYPNLKPTEAFKLSKKIIKGNRSELFWLDVSFIPWFLLCAITCGIASIYVIPYCFTTQALYYENFRMRALAEGRVSEDDFLSAEERMRKYSSSNNQENYYNPNYSAGQNYYTRQSDTQNNYYYQPNQAEPETENFTNANYSYAKPQGDGVSGEYAEEKPFDDNEVNYYTSDDQGTNSENQ
ncbi:MAG: DUF975 family protein [Eubacterium sp.]